MEAPAEPVTVRPPDVSSVASDYLYSNKPFAITEWGIESGDDPAFVRRLFTWTERHPRTKMLVYYQDFGESNSFRIQNFPQGRKVLSQFLNKRDYPKFAPKYPRFR